MERDKENQAPQQGADERALADVDSAKGDVEERMNEANEKGYFGDKVDPTPNENYSLETEEFRTPETDPELAKDAFLAARFPDSLPDELGPGPRRAGK